MSDHFALVKWTRRKSEVFTNNKYSRRHIWQFDEGIQVPASVAPSLVVPPYSSADAVDPEEAFVASLSSCHMLFFLSIAARQHLVVDSYTDHAVGTMEINNVGRISITKVILRPKVVFQGENVPSYDQVKAIHDNSHQQCFIANSVNTEVIIDIEM
ncbi:OsmC family protein [Sessilibacter corallicola]|uniref:OsmC family protein n=1 Tax=Sessilibacter corallicola TaxID=2904075 RepID=A0ABQ0A5V8_9GAMM